MADDHIVAARARNADEIGRRCRGVQRRHVDGFADFTARNKGGVVRQCAGERRQVDRDILALRCGAVVGLQNVEIELFDTDQPVGAKY